MRLFLFIFALIALAYAVLFGLLAGGGMELSDIQYNGTDYIEEFRWASCALFAVLSVLCLLLFDSSKRSKRKLKEEYKKIDRERDIVSEERQEVRDLVGILKNTKKNQLAVLELLEIKSEFNQVSNESDGLKMIASSEDEEVADSE